jgi:type IX secretion system PorP/SprF family membrane protein
MMRILHYLIVPALLIGLDSAAQQAPLYSLYYYQPIMYNPAFTGNGNEVNTFLAHHSQWKNFPGAPEATIFGIDAPLRTKKNGLGAAMHHHQAGFMERLAVRGYYSYTAEFSPDSRLKFGMGAGIINNRIDFSQALVKDHDDPYLLEADLKKTAFDAQAGLAYLWKELRLGISIPQLAGNSISYTGTDKSSVYRLERQVIFSARHLIRLDNAQQYTLSPLLIVRAGGKSPACFDMNAVLGIRNTAWVGIFYRSKYAAGMNVKVNVHKKLGMAYAYTLLAGEAGTYRGAAHEFMLTYAFNTGADKKEMEQRLEKYQQEVTLLNQKIQLISDSLQAVNQEGAQDLKAVISELNAQVEKLKKEAADSNAALKMQIALLEERVNLLVKLIGN